MADQKRHNNVSSETTVVSMSVVDDPAFLVSLQTAKGSKLLNTSRCICFSSHLIPYQIMPGEARIMQATVMLLSHSVNKAVCASDTICMNIPGA